MSDGGGEGSTVLGRPQEADVEAGVRAPEATDGQAVGTLEGRAVGKIEGRAVGTIKVFVYADDPITQAGTTAQLAGMDDIEVVGQADLDQATVALVTTAAVDDDALRVVRAVQRNGCPKVVLLATDFTDQDLLVAVEAGVAALVRRGDASPAELAAAVRAAGVGGASMPGDLLGALLRQVRDVQARVLSPHGLRFSGLSEREVAVLRLLADGHDTREIADQLAYSERTIKHVIGDITRRLGLRNRSHAVAYALRQGLI